MLYYINNDYNNKKLRQILVKFNRHYLRKASYYMYDPQNKKIILYKISDFNLRINYILFNPNVSKITAILKFKLNTLSNIIFIFIN